MKNLKHRQLQFSSKVLIEFENKSKTVKLNNPTDPTVTTMTMTTGTGMMINKKENHKHKLNSALWVS